MIPIVALCAEAGAGKDSFGKYIADHYNGVCIGQADVLKWMAREWFQFTEGQLFGPSEKRNEVDPRFASERELGVCHGRLLQAGPGWCEKLFPQKADEAFRKLQDWFDGVVAWAKEHKGLSARYVLQTLGTEYGRALDKMVWTRYAAENGLRLLGGGYEYDRRYGIQEAKTEGPGLVLCCDGRFRNEALQFRIAGGWAIRLVRGGAGAAAQAAGVVGHRSETELAGIPGHFFDFVVHNNGTLEQLFQKADFVAQAIVKAGRDV